MKGGRLLMASIRLYADEADKLQLQQQMHQASSVLANHFSLLLMWGICQ